MIRLLIVEDQAIVSKGMQMSLAAEPDFMVLGETASSDEALDLATSLCPDVVIIDMDMPQIDGVALANKLHLFCPQTSVIFLSMQDDFATNQRAAQAGVTALVGKFLPADTLMAQIRQSASIY